MLCEEQDLEGNVRGSVVCGNPACRKVLQVYEGDENRPGPDRSGYMLLKVEARILFVDKHGHPVPPIPLWLACRLGADITLNLGGRAVGYRGVPGTGTLVEDFCSDRCASQFLASNPEWGLCLRQQVSNFAVFVAHAPDRFRTEKAQVN